MKIKYLLNESEIFINRIASGLKLGVIGLGFTAGCTSSLPPAPDFATVRDRNLVDSGTAAAKTAGESVPIIQRNRAQAELTLKRARSETTRARELSAQFR